MISAGTDRTSIPQTRSMTHVNIQGSVTDLVTQQPAFVQLSHGAVKRQLGQLEQEGGRLENSAGGPASKEGCSFVVDLVLKDFAWRALPISVPLPPTHFHLKTHKTQMFVA